MPRDPQLLDYLIILKKHQWLIVSFLLTVVTVVTIATFKAKPVYIAAARVEVDREAQAMQQPFPDANSYDEFADLENYIETQTKILESETLALATIKSLDLEKISGVRRQSECADCSTNRPDRTEARHSRGVSGRAEHQARSEQSVDRGAIRSGRSAARGAGGQRPRPELHRGKLPQPVRCDDAGFELALG